MADRTAFKKESSLQCTEKRVKVLFCLFPFLLILSCAANEGTWRKPYDPLDNPINAQADQIRISIEKDLMEYQKLLVQYSSTHIKQLLPIILTYTQIVEQKVIRVNIIAERSRYIFAIETSYKCNIIYCEMLMKTAELYARDDDKAIAKGLYRNLIVTYTAPMYKSYVKKAEFGLEDLK